MAQTRETGAKATSVPRERGLVRGMTDARLGVLSLRVAMAALACAYAYLVFLGFTHTPIDVDEGYNMSVVRNFVDGNGYASDGLLTTGVRDPFDVRISTGPAMLLPVAALHAYGVPVWVAGRVIATLFAGLLVWSLWRLGARIAGSWAGLLAAAAPLVVDTFTNGESPLYGPTDMLGEYAALGLCVCALLAVNRRPWLAGLLLGLAIQAKLFALLALPALLLAVWALRRGAGRRSVWGTLGAVIGTAAVPTVAFEVWKVATLGWGAYRESTSAYIAFVRRHLVNELFVDEKSASLLQSWFIPGVVVVVVVALLAFSAGVALGRAKPRARGASGPRPFAEATVLGCAATIAGATIVAQWFASYGTLSLRVRHAAPGAILLAACALAATVLVVRRLRSDFPPAWHRRLGVVTVAVTAASVVAAASTHLGSAASEQRYGTLGEQRDVANAVVASGATEVQGHWGIVTAIAALADVPAVRVDATIRSDVPLLLDLNPVSPSLAQDLAFHDALCGDEIVDGPVTVCWPVGSAP